MKEILWPYAITKVCTDMAQDGLNRIITLFLLGSMLATYNTAMGKEGTVTLNPSTVSQSNLGRNFHRRLVVH
jgi:hypothetical protein